MEGIKGRGPEAENRDVIGRESREQGEGDKESDKKKALRGRGRDKKRR